MKQALILAGGKGTRLRSRCGDLPKSLVDVGGTPLLGHQLKLLREHKFTKVVLLVNYGANYILNFCKGLEESDFRISIIDDGEARGTAGAVLHALPALDEHFAVLYGDTMLQVDLTLFWNWHFEHPNSDATLFLHPNDHPQDSDLVEVDEQDRILGFHSYPHPDDAYLPNLVNAALYIVRRDTLPPPSRYAGPVDFAKDLFPQMLANGATLTGYISPEYIKDAGTPERLDKVCSDLASGKMERASLDHPQRAVLIDRDGTLNEERGHISSPDNLEIFVFAGPALRRLNQSDWRTVLITNQPVVARGEATVEDIRQIHAKLDTIVARSGAYFDRKYVCPHHPDGGFPGEVEALKVRCECRKPAPGLIYRARDDLRLELAESWFVGDRVADMEAAAAAGVSSILVRTGVPGTFEAAENGADFLQKDFAGAVDFILYSYPALARISLPIIEKMEEGSEWLVAGPCRSDVRLCQSILRRELRRRGVRAGVELRESFAPGPGNSTQHVIFVACSHSEPDVSDYETGSLRVQDQAGTVHLLRLPPELSSDETLLSLQGPQNVRVHAGKALP